jgi:hypothetical protein
MIAVHPEFIIDAKDNKKSVVLPFREWKFILEKMEELDDIKLYDEAKKEKSDPVPFLTAVNEVKGKRN